VAKRLRCSARCYGIWRSKDPTIREHMAKIAPMGVAAMTPDVIAKRAAKMRGANNPAWKGGVTLNRSKGNYRGAQYVRSPPEFLPMARPDGYIAEHRLVVARALGRLLTSRETVHHINHDPRDNRVENLMLFKSHQDHMLFEAHGSPLPLWSGSSTPDACGASPCPPERS
jgi:hypothetical protein